LRANNHRPGWNRYPNFNHLSTSPINNNCVQSIIVPLTRVYEYNLDPNQVFIYVENQIFFFSKTNQHGFRIFQRPFFMALGAVGCVELANRTDLHQGDGFTPPLIWPQRKYYGPPRTPLGSCQHQQLDRSPLLCAAASFIRFWEVMSRALLSSLYESIDRPSDTTV
jgi:hypothetical protein